MYWTPAERAGLRAMADPIVYSAKDCQFHIGALTALRAFVDAARAVKDRESSNRVDVSSIKSWTGRGMIELDDRYPYWVELINPFGSFDMRDLITPITIETQQDRED